MDVFIPTATSVLRLRRRQEGLQAAHLSVLSGFLGSAYSIKRTKMNGVKKKHIPGTIFKKNGIDLYNVPTAKPVLVDHRGNHPNMVHLVPTLIGDERDVYPGNLYTCHVCYGSGANSIFSPEMHEKLKGMNPDDQQMYYKPMTCTACAGKGIPPIPWGELK